MPTRSANSKGIGRRSRPPPGEWDRAPLGSVQPAKEVAAKPLSPFVTTRVVTEREHQGLAGCGHPDVRTVRTYAFLAWRAGASPVLGLPWATNRSAFCRGPESPGRTREQDRSDQPAGRTVGR